MKHSAFNIGAASRPRPGRLCAPLWAFLAMMALPPAASGQTAWGPTNVPQPAPASEGPASIIVFDGSGSMAAPLAQTRLPKVGVAREALAGVLPKVPQGLRLGLVAFGHRRGDCGDVELLRAPASIDAEGMTPQLERLSPRGRGPIALALRTAARALPQDASPRSLILIHDDADNCALDTCAAAIELARAKITVHVVSLNLKPDDRPKMACLPQTTGGRFYNATSTEEVGAAISEALKLAAADLAKPTPRKLSLAGREAAADVPPSAPRGLYLRARLAASTAPLSEALHWLVTPEGEQRIAVLNARVANPYLDLAPGRYKVELRDGAVVARSDVVVGADKPTVLNLPLEAGIVRVRLAAQSAGLKLPRMLVTVAALTGGEPPLGGPPGEVISAYQGSEGNMLLPAGNYLVRAEAGLVRAQQVITVEAGKELVVDMPLKGALLQLAAATAFEGAPPVFIVLADDPEAPLGQREVARSAERQPEFVLPPGTYTAVMRQGSVEHSERVALGAGDVVQRTLAVAGAQVALSSRLGAQPIEDHVSYRLDRLDGPPGAVTTVSRPQPVLLLAAGRYRVEARYGSANASVARDVEVKAGAPQQQIVFEQQAGDVRLRALNAPGEVFWEVRDGTGRQVWASGQPEPLLTLQAGRYTVVASARDKRAEAVLDVRLGDKRSLDVKFQ